MSHIPPEFEVSNDEQDPLIVQEVIKMPSPSDLVGAGTILSFGAVVEFIPEGKATIVFNIYGTWNQTNIFEATVDDVNWFSIEAWKFSTKQYVSSFTANDQFYIFCSAFKKVRIRNTVLTSGTCTITYDASSSTFQQRFSIDNLGRQINRIAGVGSTHIADVVTNGGLERLAVLATLDPGGKIIPTLGTNLTYNDMNATTGTLARNTIVTNGIWIKTYEYLGSGLLMAILVSLENLVADTNKFWQIRMIVDGIEIFGANGLSCEDLGSVNIYGWHEVITTLAPTLGGISLVQNSFRWDTPGGLPMSFATSVQVYIKHTGDNRRFYAGLAVIVKET